jgi:SAM-dependent methyltransferase
MDRNAWDERYAGEELLWRAEPNQSLAREVAGLPPGRALDLACGEGRNAVWLAQKGWKVTAVDFSAVALRKGQRLAADRRVSVSWVQADLLEWAAPERSFELVVVLYLQLPSAERPDVYGRAGAAVAPGGTWIVVGHDLENLGHGYGGPQDPDVLLTPDEVAAYAAGLNVLRAERVVRLVTVDGGQRQAIDALVRCVRPS